MNSKSKGSRNERALSAWLRHTGIDHKAERNVGSGGGRIKSDNISPNTGLNIETKSYSSLGLTSRAMKQSIRDAEMSGTMPIVFLRENQMSDDTWYVVMYSDHWANLWKRAKEPVTLDTQSKNNELVWTVKSTIKALKHLLQLLEK